MNFKNFSSKINQQPLVEGETKSKTQVKKIIPTRLGLLIVLLATTISGAGMWWSVYSYEEPKVVDVSHLVLQLQERREIKNNEATKIVGDNKEKIQEFKKTEEYREAIVFLVPEGGKIFSENISYNRSGLFDIALWVKKDGVDWLIIGLANTNKENKYDVIKSNTALWREVNGSLLDSYEGLSFQDGVLKIYTGGTSNAGGHYFSEGYEFLFQEGEFYLIRFASSNSVPMEGWEESIDYNLITKKAENHYIKGDNELEGTHCDFYEKKTYNLEDKPLINLKDFNLNTFEPPDFSGEESSQIIRNDCPQLACLAKGTTILMSDGIYKKIENIQVGDLVISFDTEKKEYKTSKVNKVIKRKDPIIVINNSLKAAPDELVYLAGGEIKEAINVVVGEYLLDENLKQVMVESIQKEEILVDTYDFTLENGDNFFADGYLVATPNL